MIIEFLFFIFGVCIGGSGLYFYYQLKFNNYKEVNLKNEQHIKNISPGISTKDY